MGSKRQVVMNGSRPQCDECGGYFSIFVLQDMDGSPQCSVDSPADYREECRSAVLAQAWKAQEFKRIVHRSFRECFLDFFSSEFLVRSFVLASHVQPLCSTFCEAISQHRARRL